MSEMPVQLDANQLIEMLSADMAGDYVVLRRALVQEKLKSKAYLEMIGSQQEQIRSLEAMISLLQTEKNSDDDSP